MYNRERDQKEKGKTKLVAKGDAPIEAPSCYDQWKNDTVKWLERCEIGSFPTASLWCIVENFPSECFFLERKW